MKTVVLLLLLLVVITQNEALRCNCGGRKYCPNPVETCYGTADQCGTTIFHFDASYSQSCMSSRDCSTLNHPRLMTTTCCSWDECNR